MLKTGPTGVAVDIMRGVLALMVLLAHALESGLLMVKDATLPAWMTATFGHGGFWVNGFFVLSGFCIHRSIMSQRSREESFGPTYVFARATRLYPLYFLSLLLALMISVWPSTGSLLSHLFMFQGITGTIPAIKPAWSLTYEAAYYAAWPLALISCGWRAGRAFIVAGIGTLLVAGSLFVVWKRLQGGVDGSFVLPLALIAAQFPLWLGGAWLAQVWPKLLHHSRSWMAPTAFLWITAGYLFHAWMLHRHASTSMIILLNWLVVPGWLGLVLGSVNCSRLTDWSSSARWLGLLSYPLYILHQVLLDVVVIGGHACGLRLSLTGTVILLLIWVMVCMVMAGVPLEAWLLKWRAHWLSQQRLRGLKSISA